MRFVPQSIHDIHIAYHDDLFLMRGGTTDHFETQSDYIYIYTYGFLMISMGIGMKQAAER